MYALIHQMQITGVPAAGFELRLSQVPAAGYKLQLIPSYGWLELRRLDTSCGWLRPTADSSSGGWIWVVADSVLQLTRVPAAWYELQLILSCSWLRVVADSSSAGWTRYAAVLFFKISSKFKDFLFAKYIIFMVYFLPLDFSYHWFRLCLLLQEPWRSLKKLEKAWRNFKTLAAADSRPSTNRLLPEFWPLCPLIHFKGWHESLKRIPNKLVWKDPLCNRPKLGDKMLKTIVNLLLLFLFLFISNNPYPSALM